MTNVEMKLPEAEKVSINVEKSAVLVLDISQEHCTDPKFGCSKIVPGLKKFLDRAREVGLPIIHTISYRLRGTPGGQVHPDLMRRPLEPVLYPDAFDKFAGGELQQFLDLHGAETLIITGFRSNISVLNTATKATRELKYNVVIPMDGIAAYNDFEKDYTLYHFTVLPAQASRLFTYTRLEMISFS